MANAHASLRPALEALSALLEAAPLNLRKARWHGLTSDARAMQPGAGELSHANRGEVYTFILSGGDYVPATSHTIDADENVAIIVFRRVDEGKDPVVDQLDLVDLGEDVQGVITRATTVDARPTSGLIVEATEQGDAWILVIPCAVRYLLDLSGS